MVQAKLLSLQVSTTTLGLLVLSEHGSIQRDNSDIL